MKTLLRWAGLPLFGVAVLSSLAVALLAFFGLPYSPLSSANGNPYVLTGSIQGLKFDDVNSNGIKDLGEAGVSGVTICISPGGCTTTNITGNYSFTGLAAGSYTVFELVPFGRINTTPTFQVVSVGAGQTVAGVNFGNRVITPPPPDVQIVSQAGTTTNNTPTQSRFTNLVIRKTIAVCSPVGAPKVTLTFPGGTVLTGNMTNIGGNLWEVVFSPTFPGGTATLRIDIDCPPDTPGYPENPANISGEDVIEIGDIVFLDPSGAILNGCTGQPLGGATVTLLKETPVGSGNFVVPSNSDHIPATNPQTTGADGVYAWVVVPGVYKVRAEKSGFVTNESVSLVIPPPVTGLNISLVPVGGCQIAVSIDIKPGSDPNSEGCQAKGVLPVAVLSTATFDATTIEANSVRFGKAGTEAAETHESNGQKQRHIEDVNGDGRNDMVFHFRLEATGFSCNDVPQGQKSSVVSGKLTGTTANSATVEGVDALRLVGTGK